MRTKWRVETAGDGHHGQVTATPAWPAQGPLDRDELAEWTTIELADRVLGALPPLSGPPPGGWTEVLDGRGIYLRRQPGPTGATPVWFVHGLGGASTDWTRLGAALAPIATGYSLDLPGSGRSDPPPAGRYSPGADADLVASAIVAVTGGPVHLVGNSYGGVVATLFARTWPDEVAGLVMVDVVTPLIREVASTEAVASAVREATRADASTIAAAESHARTFTWARTVSETRALVSSVL